MTPREQTERALIGCCLEQPDFTGELKSAWFDDHAIAALHLAIGELLLAGKPIDAGTVLHAAGSAPETLALILECQEQCVSTANFAHWREIIVAETPPGVTGVRGLGDKTVSRHLRPCVCVHHRCPRFV